MSKFNEAVVEEAAIEYLTGTAALSGLGYTYCHGDALKAERGGLGDVILERRFRTALGRINPGLSAAALDAAARAVLHLNSPSLEENNVVFHRMLTRGIEVEWRDAKGRNRGDLAWLIDFERPDNNDWLVVNQLTIVGFQTHRNARRPDLIVYLNGLPVAVFELKNPTDPQATLDGAWNQLQTYKRQIPQLFYTNGVLVISDGTEAQMGSLTAPLERFGPWRTVDGTTPVPEHAPPLRTLLEGLFDRGRFLDYLRYFGFWVQDADTGRFIKKVAGYHQYYAVNKSVEATVAATKQGGDGRAGVVWHTQGSGKSVSMVFFAGKLIQHPALANPTLVILTDRNDLDGQLFGQFTTARDHLPQPTQAESRDHLRDLLQVASGGIVFTTIQKFGTRKGERMPTLTERRNVVVIVDEAHRSQYEFIDGFARNLRDALPKATYIGFTGTPIEFEDRSTPEVFGDYIDTYTISESIEDGATVPIYYESRLAAVDLPEARLPVLDEAFEEVTEDEEAAEVVKLQSSWKRIEAIVGLKKRLKLVAQDLLDHYDRRTEILEGKAMIVCMSRRICVDLYRELIRRRPEWHADQDEAGQIKIVMTGSASDPPDFIPHVRNKPRRKLIEKRFKEPIEEAEADGRDPLRMVIVRDMWLTGFDVPSAHTLYLDKPMKGHSLMQAIARVNRIYKDKPGGLVVDYLGVAQHLREAVEVYGGKRERAALPTEEALAVLRTELGIVRDLFFGFDYSRYFTGGNADRLEVLQAAMDHVLGLDPVGDTPGEQRFKEAMTRLNKAAALAVHLEGARSYLDEIGFFQQIQKSLRKPSPGSKRTNQEALGLAIKQLVSGAVITDGVIDVFATAGIDKPDLSILSDAFLQTVRTHPHKNLQVELLRRLLEDEIQTQRRRNVVQAARFSDMLQETIRKYQNRTLEAAEIIATLIEMAQEMQAAKGRGQQLGLTDDELAFYDALVAQEGVQEVMNDDVLGAIAADLVKTVRNSVSIDWSEKEAVRAKMRARVKRLLRRHGYPPDQQEEAVQKVIQQAETLGWSWEERL